MREEIQLSEIKTGECINDIERIILSTVLFLEKKQQQHEKKIYAVLRKMRNDGFHLYKILNDLSSKDFLTEMETLDVLDVRLTQIRNLSFRVKTLHSRVAALHRKIREVELEN